jgi:hypothetical protein
LAKFELNDKGVYIDSCISLYGTDTVLINIVRQALKARTTMGYGEV